MEDTESCSSRASESVSAQSRKRRQKVEVYHEIVRRLRDSDHEEASQPGFEDELWAHFNRLPIRYAMDVNVERPEDVLMHKKLLHLAYDSATRPAFEVRLVQVHPVSEVSCSDSVHSNFIKKEEAHSSDFPCGWSIHPPFAFGLLPNLEAVLEANKSSSQVGVDGNLHIFRHLYEITISTVDKPKLLSQLTSLLSEIGLNIQEAHAFSTSDGYSLDVFVVDGWGPEETEQLRTVLLKEIPKIEKLSRSKNQISPAGDLWQTGSELYLDHVNIPTDGIDVWEIDPKRLKFERKIASGLYGDLYKGTFHSQDVAIKVLNAEYLNEDVRRDFAQEVYILRFITYILVKHLSMIYLLKLVIFHNILNNGLVVKVADFGVARVQTTSGVMTAETGTYRWMAPEVIEHKPYGRKADVFSFGIVLWELLTGKLPYEYLTPLQAAIGVVQKGLRPIVPKHTHPVMVELLERCWQQDPSLRPEFSEIIEILQQISKKFAEEERTDKKMIQVGEIPEQVDRGGQ
ncbi:serine/threonine-protein kinase STY46-like [Diospyros lotus]|uniref:serine/threonine-protein kinase STY46-like n=1 Tax=Diospyros lotus TaxID=55363 RepID=UPI002255F410|nr:serine/threonine-protein kinase STY46-like [Diospyros lotus]